MIDRGISIWFATALVLSTAERKPMHNSRHLLKLLGR